MLNNTVFVTSLYSFNCNFIVVHILYHQQDKNKTFSWKLAADVTFKQKRYAHIFLVQILYIKQNLAREREVKRSQRMYRTMDEKKRKVRWRLDGYLQTENMEEKPRVLAS